MASANTSISDFELDTIFTRAKNIFFAGIGGISMSALAHYCVSLGKRVFGYDSVRSERCLELESVAHIRYCSTTDSVMGMDLVIFSNAIDWDSFELKRARELKIPLVSRSNFLAYLTSSYPVRIGVAGTHGKSTTTSMIYHIFDVAGRDASVVCGAVMKDTSLSYRFGKGETFIFEACEYMNSFLNFSPSDAVVTNVDLDHTDFFEDMGKIRASFQEYIVGARRVFINADDYPSSLLSHPFKVSFGIEKKAEYMAKLDTYEGKRSISILHNGKKIGEFYPHEYGRHNVYNALCAFAVAHKNKIAPEVICSALSSYQGIFRRQEYVKDILVGCESKTTTLCSEENEKSVKNGHICPLFFDYAHHPTEIRASLDAFSEMGYKKILCIFQSHTYSRTFSLYDAFCGAFKKANELIVLPIFPAREKNIYKISDEKFAHDIGGELMSDASKIAHRVAQSNADLVVIMGAGDAPSLVKWLK